MSYLGMTSWAMIGARDPALKVGVPVLCAASIHPIAFPAPRAIALELITQWTWLTHAMHAAPATAGLPPALSASLPRRATRLPCSRQGLAPRQSRVSISGACRVVEHASIWCIVAHEARMPRMVAAGPFVFEMACWSLAGMALLECMTRIKIWGGRKMISVLTFQPCFHATLAQGPHGRTRTAGDTQLDMAHAR